MPWRRRVANKRCIGNRARNPEQWREQCRESVGFLELIDQP